MKQKFDEQKYQSLYTEFRTRGLTPEGVTAFKNLKQYLEACGEKFQDYGRLYFLLNDAWDALNDFGLGHALTHLWRPLTSYFPFTPANRKFKEGCRVFKKKLKIRDSLFRAIVD